MPRTGLVLSVDGSHATISTMKRGVCESCAESGACNANVSIIKEKPEIVVADNTLGARPGELVDFDLPNGQELRVSLLVWIVPLIGMLAGVAVGALLSEPLPISQDAAAVIGAGLGLLAAFGVLKIIDRRSETDERLTLTVTRVVTTIDSCAARDDDSADPAEIIDLPNR